MMPDLWILVFSGFVYYSAGDFVFVEGVKWGKGKKTDSKISPYASNTIAHVVVVATREYKGVLGVPMNRENPLIS